MGRMELEVLKGIKLDIYRNEYVALMGPSGSGKSTLMNIIGCLDTPTAGNYILNGQDISKTEDNKLAEIRNKEIGFVFQQFNLLPRLTALENVALPLVYSGMGKRKRTEKAKHVMDLVNLSDRELHKPNELSGGQCQRVAIARALVNDPSIILADEPTGNLDTKTSYEIMEIFDKIHSAGNTIVLVTHETDIANHAHRIVRLRDGMIESDMKNESAIRHEASKPTQNEYEGLVSLAHSITYDQLHLPDAGDKEVLYGVIMDWYYQSDVTITLVSFITGDTSIYFSTGAMIIGGGQHKNVKSKALEYIENAKSVLSRAQPDSNINNEKGFVTFYLHTNKNKYVIKDKTENVLTGNSILTPYFNKANELIAEIRQAEEKMKQTV